MKLTTQSVTLIFIGIVLALVALAILYFRSKDGYLGMRSFVAGRGPYDGETLEAPTYGIDAHWGNVAHPFGLPVRPI